MSEHPDGAPPRRGVRRGSGEPPPDHAATARDVALRQLATAPRSREQLRHAMARKEVPAEVAEQVLDRLEQVQLVDDGVFADGWVRHRQRDRGLARRALAHELRHRGVDDEVARTALDQVSADDERAAAQRLVAKRLPAAQRLEPEVALRRLVGMLARKGYPPGTAMQVVREALAGSQGGQDRPGTAG